MRPELHGSVQDADTAQRALNAMQRIAPEATTWTLGLPGPRQVAVAASWREPGAATGRAGTKRAEIDAATGEDRKSTRLNSSHLVISYAVFCLKKKNYDLQHY